MTTLFFDNPRLVFLTVVITILAGVAGLWMLPRMEDPPMTPRAATLVTDFPGAEAERVAALVTEPLESALEEIEEIKEVQSESRTGVSFLAIELADSVTETEAHTLWGRVRDKASDAALSFPPGAGNPDLDPIEIRAFALLVGLRWDSELPTNYGLLRRLSEQLRDRIDAVDGTERTEIFGEAPEEVLVTIRPEAVASIELSAADIAGAISSRDAKVAAGAVRSGRRDVLIGVSGELQTLTSIGEVPIQVSDDGALVELADIADIEKTVVSPPPSKVLLRGKPAIVLGAMVRDSFRLDQWSEEARDVLRRFQDELPEAVSLDLVLDQNEFVQQRIGSLGANLIYSAIAVVVVAAVFQGVRASAIVAFTIPMITLSVLAAMHWIGIPINQMSVAGLIVSIGLMIDASLISVDEVARRIETGIAPRRAVSDATKFLFIPLLNAALTTVLAFAPIALMPGPSGEFVGAIGSVTILAILFAVFWSLTLVVALAGWWRLDASSGARGGPLAWVTRRLLGVLYRYPALGVAGCIGTSAAGMLCFLTLQEQFFPAADREQFHVEMSLPQTTSIEETERVALALREAALGDERIERVSWFLGASAPEFYYNVVPDRQNSPSYGQAVIVCRAGTPVAAAINDLQREFDQLAPQASIAVRQLEQGPPFSAPIEIRLFGPSPETLDRLSEEVRLVLSETPRVVLTRDEASDAMPKVMFAVDEDQAKIAGLSQVEIARILSQTLEGVTGGAILEGDEELPVRVRVSRERRADLNRIASLELLSYTGAGPGGLSTVSLSAIAAPELSDEDAVVSRVNGQNVNEVMVFLEAGALPTEVQKDFLKRLAESGFELPPGYSMQFGGADARRDEAIENLLANTVVWGACFVSVLVLSFQSFKHAGIILAVGGLAFGYGLGSLWAIGLPWGFMAVVGAIGMLGAVVNDSIIVLSVLRALPASQAKRPSVILDAIMENSRHIWSTTATTVIGFAPLVLDGGSFWTPVAVTVAGGVLWGTFLSLVFVPCAFLLAGGRHAADELAAIGRDEADNGEARHESAERLPELVCL